MALDIAMVQRLMRDYNRVKRERKRINEMLSRKDAYKLTLVIVHPDRTRPDLPIKSLTTEQVAHLLSEVCFALDARSCTLHASLHGIGIDGQPKETAKPLRKVKPAKK